MLYIDGNTKPCFIPPSLFSLFLHGFSIVILTQVIGLCPCMYSFRRWVTDCISNRTISNFDSFVVSPILWMTIIILTAIAIYYCRKVDWRLTIYSACYFFSILWFASLDSVVRYLSFIFPIWIAFGTCTLCRKWGKMLSVILCALFFIRTFVD